MLKKLLIVLFLFTIYSCKEDINQENKGFKYFLNSYSGQSYNLDDLINDLNDQDLVGVVELKSNKRNDFVFNKLAGGIPTTISFDGFDNYAYASLFDASYNPVDVNSIVINASTLKQYAPGAYHKVGEDDFDVFMQGSSYQNKILIDSINGFPDVLDSFSLPSQVAITNLFRNDKIDTSNDLILNWVGGDINSKCEIKIHHATTIDSVFTDEKFEGTSFLINNTGNYTFKSNSLQHFLEVEGYHHVRVTTFDPVYLNLSNNKKILIVAVNSHNITVFVKH